MHMSLEELHYETFRESNHQLTIIHRTTYLHRNGDITYRSVTTTGGPCEGPTKK